MVDTKCMLAAALVAVSALPAQEPRRAADSLSPAAPAADVTRSNQLLGTLMSPFCPGLTLASCPSFYAETLRVSVRARLDAGEPPERVVESLVAVFGEGIRGAPRARGLGLVLWTLPVIALAAGGIGVAWWTRQRGARAVFIPANTDPRSPVPPPAPEELAQLEAALREYD
jgi:cytochrome c-type biogenesis protein CcmH/NrfF